MDSLSLVYYPSRILNRRAEDIKEITDDIRELGKNMAEAMVRFQGVGLAGPQVNVGKRIVVVQDEKEILVCVNPQILEQSKEQDIQEEGCLSLPGMYLKIKRPKEVKVRYLDLEGNTVERSTTGLASRIFQHEIDHINGILIIHKVSLWKRLQLRTQLKQIAKNGKM